MARKLGLPEDSNSSPLQRVAEWLSDEDKGHWLILLDNADDEDILFKHRVQGSSRSLVDYLPKSPHGSIAITTRDKRIGLRLAGANNIIEVPPFGNDDAKQLLRSKMAEETELDGGEVKELFETLDYLPLAITQAAAYILEEGMTLQDYLGYLQCKSETSHLLRQDYYDATRDSETQNSVFLTWRLSFEHIKKQRPRAADLLSLMTVLDRQSIPEDLLYDRSESKAAYQSAIGTLKSFYLVSEQSVGKIFELHRLVQLAMQLWLEEHGVLQQWQSEALSAVSHCCPTNAEDFNLWPSWEVLSPHIKTVLECILVTREEQLERASLFHRTAWYEYRRGIGDYGTLKFEKALELRRSILGERNKATLDSMRGMSVGLLRLSRTNDAEDLIRHVLEVQAETMGKEHPDTMASMNNLALVLANQNRWEEAEKMIRPVLKFMADTCGEKGSETLRSMSVLVRVLIGQGKYDEAEAISQRQIALNEEVFGAKHRSSLYSMGDVGKLLYFQERYEEAETVHRKVLALGEEILGKHHAFTLGSASNLSLVLANQGMYDQAEEMLRKTVALQEEHLGASHLGTLVGMNSLGWILNRRGDHVAAEEILWRVLGLKREVVGESHPQAMKTMSVLVDALKGQRKHSEAENLQRRIDRLRKERKEEMEKRREQQREEEFGGKREEEREEGRDRGEGGGGASYKVVEIREQQRLRGDEKSHKTDHSHFPDTRKGIPET